MKYDVVIAGGGTAGAILAARLSEDPARAVLLLEAGPDYAGIDALPPKIRDGYTTAADITPSDHDWGYTGRATPLAGPLAVPRGKLTGGSSAVNGQIFLRGIPEDFDAWAALGNPAWSFQRVLPFFRRLERDLDFRTDYHGADGPIPVRRFPRAEWLPPQVAFHSACLDAGFADCPDLNAPAGGGRGPCPAQQLPRRALGHQPGLPRPRAPPPQPHRPRPLHGAAGALPGAPRHRAAGLQRAGALHRAG